MGLGLVSATRWWWRKARRRRRRRRVPPPSSPPRRRRRRPPRRPPRFPRRSSPRRRSCLSMRCTMGRPPVWRLPTIGPGHRCGVRVVAADSGGDGGEEKLDMRLSIDVGLPLANGEPLSPPRVTPVCAPPRPAAASPSLPSPVPPPSPGSSVSGSSERSRSRGGPAIRVRRSPGGAPSPSPTLMPITGRTVEPGQWLPVDGAARRELAGASPKRNGVAANGPARAAACTCSRKAAGCTSSVGSTRPAGAVHPEAVQLL